MKHRLLTAAVLLALCLCGCGPLAQEPETTLPPQATAEPTVQTTAAPIVPTTVQTLPPTGWQEENGLRYYLHEDGTRATGWLEDAGNTYYLDENGNLYTGWLELDGSTYYLKEDGTLAKGALELGGSTYHFTSTGSRIIMVNPWNYIPEDYTPDLVSLSTKYGVEGSKVDSSCYDDLIAMMDACNAECPTAYVVSSYRTHEYQTQNHNRKISRLMAQGYDEETARIEAAKVVAVPGTSEHQLGLAVDIIDTRLWKLTRQQAEQPAQKWLMEHSWEYGFILRYPDDMVEVTGIIYEPWHYRYVGREVARELYESGLTLEEYIANLTQ